MTSPTDEATALLIRARGFVERGWCRFKVAEDSEGKEVHPRAASAVAWCASGALEAVGEVIPRRAIARLNDAMGSVGIAYFNDRQETVAPILAAFDRAIAAAREASR